MAQQFPQQGLFGDIYNTQLQDQFVRQQGAQGYGTGWEAMTKAAAETGGMLGSKLGLALGGQTPAMMRQAKIAEIQKEFADSSFDDASTYSKLAKRFMDEGFGDLALKSIEFGTNIQKLQKPLARKILKASDGTQRFVDTGERVFSKLGKKSDTDDDQKIYKNISGLYAQTFCKGGIIGSECQVPINNERLQKKYTKEIIDASGNSRVVVELPSPEEFASEFGSNTERIFRERTGQEEQEDTAEAVNVSSATSDEDIATAYSLTSDETSNWSETIRILKANGVSDKAILAKIEDLRKAGEQSNLPQEGTINVMAPVADTQLAPAPGPGLGMGNTMPNQGQLTIQDYDTGLY
jgi:hypothetical protein